jgi:predicted transglutaminase-like cysteine proteinase
LAAGAGLFAASLAAQAAPPPAPPMPLGAAAEPPPGFLAFCGRQPEDCGDDPAAVRARLAELSAHVGWRARFAAARARAPGALGRAGSPRVRAPAAPATLTPELWAEAVRVNAAVNRAIIRKSDQDDYGVEDRWATPLAEGGRYGDCEDYVLEKRRALLAAGVPAHALHIALVTTRWGEAHAVLLLSLDRGEYVLDNLTSWITPWNQAPYRWGVRQAGVDPFVWVAAQAPARVALAGY